MALNGKIPPTIAPRKPVKGLLGDSLMAKLKAASPATTDAAIVMDTVGALSTAQIASALAGATPTEHNMLFSAVPPGEIASLLARQPPHVLAPATPPPAAPSPAGGPPASILTTTFENVPYPPAETDPDWSQKVSDGSTIGLTSPPPWEWVSVYDQSAEKEGSLNNPLAGLTGWAVAPDISGADVWFVHPFGNVAADGTWSGDWEFFVAPDPQYEGLLAASNTGVTPGTGKKDDEYEGANTAAQGLGLTVPKGVLGVEIDQGLVPAAFRDTVTQGARVAVFGRWIVDCGHDDFHTEIHPPLLMASATVGPAPAGRPAESEMTSVRFWSRPYAISQQWSEGNFIDHLLAEVGKVEFTIAGIPSSWRVEAHPTVLTTPYEGRPYIKLLVQPPPRAHISPVVVPEHLMVSFHFTHRAGVAIRVFDAGNGSVGVIIVLGDPTPAPLTTKHDLTVSFSELGSKYGYVIDALQVADILTLDIAPALVLQRGILTDVYDPPQMSSPLDTQNVVSAVPLDAVNADAGLSEDDSQPFPVYGWLDVWWERTQVVAEPLSGHPVAAD
jgi:hypothetical protein